MKRSLLLLPAGLVLTVFLVVPYLDIGFISLHPSSATAPYAPGFTVRNYRDVLTNGYLLHQIAVTLWIGFCTTAATLPLGYIVAWSLTHASGRARAIQQAMVISPLLVGIVVRSYGWTILLGNNGILNRAARSLGVTKSVIPLMYNEFGIIVALTHIFLPFMIIPIADTLRTADPALVLAARSLGASKVSVFRRVILPLSGPGVQSGCILVFILSVSSYVTPMLIGGMRVKTLPMTVVNTLLDAFLWPAGAAQALILSACAIAILVIFLKLWPMKWNRQ